MLDEFLSVSIQTRQCMYIIGISNMVSGSGRTRTYSGCETVMNVSHVSYVVPKPERVVCFHFFHTKLIAELTARGIHLSCLRTAGVSRVASYCNQTRSSTAAERARRQSLGR